MNQNIMSTSQGGYWRNLSYALVGYGFRQALRDLIKHDTKMTHEYNVVFQLNRKAQERIKSLEKINVSMAKLITKQFRTINK